MSDDQAQEGTQPLNAISNTLFPPPPAYYRAFTNENVSRYTQLGGPSGTSKNRGVTADLPNTEEQDEMDRTEEEDKELQRLSILLSSPRADWIVEEGRWKTFGEVHSVNAAIPTLEEIGLPPWVDPSEPPQVSLPPLLHSFLHTLLLLLDALTGTALTPVELYERRIHHVGDPHLSNLAATMMISANQLRGVQAEATLVMLMEKQIETKRAQTDALRRKCRAISLSIQKLREATRDLEIKDDGMDVDEQERRISTST